MVIYYKEVCLLKNRKKMNKTVENDRNYDRCGRVVACHVAKLSGRSDVNGYRIVFWLDVVEECGNLDIPYRWYQVLISSFYIRLNAVSILVKLVREPGITCQWYIL